MSPTINISPGLVRVDDDPQARRIDLKNHSPTHPAHMRTGFIAW
jgi:hypothetical protein